MGMASALRSSLSSGEIGSCTAVAKPQDLPAEGKVWLRTGRRGEGQGGGSANAAEGSWSWH